MPNPKFGNGSVALNTDFRALTRALPVDLLVRVDSYALKEINSLETTFQKKCFELKAGAVGLTYKTVIKIDKLDDIVDKLTTENFDAGLSFDNIIQKGGNLKLFRTVQAEISGKHYPFNTEKLLERESIRHFLFCYATDNQGLTESTAILNFMTDARGGGVKMLTDYIAERAINEIQKKEKISGIITDPLLATAKDANIAFTAGVFYPSLRKMIDKFVFDSFELGLINDLNTAEQLKLTEAETNLLVDFIKKSKVTITPANAAIMLLPEVQKIRASGIENFPSGNTVGEGDFFVDYFQEDSATLEINKDNVLCAAQLYFVMTIGDEMDVFNVVHRIATRYLTNGSVDIRSRSLLEDLQLYVFSDRFKDLRTGAQHERTRIEERNMFQSQVFGGQYKAKMGEGMVSNDEFVPLWENLMFETAKILQKIEKSENPQLFVSRQNVAQAIEDLQYNLSTYCNGMVKVLAPLANRELDFVMKRFLQNEEIIRQLAPRSSNSVWKVIERILQEWKGKSVNVVALRNKAIYGHMIMQTIANYTPALIDDDAEFSRFINTVEAYIIANSQLEGSGDRRELPVDEEEGMYETAPSMNGHQNGHTKDDWDF